MNNLMFSEMNNILVKMASRDPEFRKELIKKLAMEMTPKEWEVYQKKHPNAKKEDHKITEETSGTGTHKPYVWKSSKGHHGMNADGEVKVFDSRGEAKAFSKSRKSQWKGKVRHLGELQKAKIPITSKSKSLAEKIVKSNNPIHEIYSLSGTPDEMFSVAKALLQEDHPKKGKLSSEILTRIYSLASNIE